MILGERAASIGSLGAEQVQPQNPPTFLTTRPDLSKSTSSAKMPTSPKQRKMAVVGSRSVGKLILDGVE